MNRFVFGFALVLTLFTIVSPIVAHVPISAQDGETLETAYFIENPTKSWVIYSELHEGGEPKYFAFEMEAGERIRLLLSIPVISDPDSFRPSVALMGPGLTNSTLLPEYLEVPESAGIMIFENEETIPEYEGFTPTAFYALVDIDIDVNTAGEYYFAIYEPNDGGSFSVALGYVESFTLDEWLLVPFSVMTIHQWNGQSLLAIIAPFVIVSILGFAYLIRKRDETQALRNPISWIGAIGALLFFGSGMTIFYQMLLSALFAVNAQVIVTAIFGLLPILLGFFTLRIVLSNGWQNERGKIIRLFLLGAIAPFLWAGLLLGPALVIISAVAASVMPSTEFEETNVQQ